MPQIITPIIVNAALGAGLSFGAGLMIANALYSIVGTLVMGVISSAMTKKPKTPDFSGFSAQAQDRIVTVRQPIAPRRVIYGTARLGGTYTFLHTTGSSKEYLHMVITLSGHEVSALGDIYFDGEVVPLDGNGDATGDYAGFVHVEKNLGTDAQTAFAGLVADAPDKWTAGHRQRGCAGIYVRLKHSTTKFPNGIPNITCEVTGKNDIYDPRTSPPTTGYSNNWALCIANYLCDSTNGLGADYSTEIDEPSLIEAANICDEQVTLLAGGTENRYECNGTFDTSERPYDIITRMATAGSGTIIYSGGKWYIRAGAYRSPDASTDLDENDIVGESLQIKTLVSRRESFNGVKGVFTSPDNLWQPDDFPAVQSAAYVAADNGEERWKDIELPFTTSVSCAQRLARIELERARRQITVDFEAKTRAYQLLPGDTVRLSLDNYGWSNKTFVVTSVTLIPDATPRVAVSLREIDSNVFAWTAGDDESVYTPSPTTTLPNPFLVLPPTDLAANSGNDYLYVDTDGTVFARMYVSWTAAADAFVDRYVLSIRKSTDAQPNTYTLDGTSTGFIFSPVKSGETYYISILSIGTFGAYSDSATLEHVVSGKSDVPPDMGTFTVTQDADGTRRFSGTYPNKPLDFAGYLIKYTNSAPLDWATDAELLGNGELIPFLPFESNDLAADDYEFGIKPVDTSGNEAANELVIAVTLGDPRLRNALYTQNEYTLQWPGTLTDCHVTYENTLEANVATTSPPSDWDSLSGTTWDDYTLWETMVPRVGSIQYETEVIDLGANLSFTPLITVTGQGTPTVTMATGESGNSPVVGSYGAVGQVLSARYAKFKIVMAHGTAPRIENIRIILDGERLIDRYEDVNTATETAAWFESIAAGHFKIEARTAAMALISQGRVDALQNVGSGYSWELISKSTTLTGGSLPAAEFKVYNSSGTLTDAVLDISLTGPKSG